MKKQVRRSNSKQKKARASDAHDGATGGLALAARRHPMVKAVRDGLKSCGIDLQHGPAKPINIIIGVSGGADSVALLLACCALSQQRSNTGRLIPIAVHVHHHLRKSADDDAKWVQQLCASLGVGCHIKHVRPGTMRGNVSAKARELRYQALAKCAEEHDSGYVAVAHHADDQFETMLAALCRGTGLDGLRAMAWSRPLNQNIALIRPLLNLRHADCVRYCAAAGIRWREDPSNTNVERTRARLRRDVVPVLEELWPDAAQRASATARLLQQLNGVWEQQVSSIIKLANVSDGSRIQWARDDLAKVDGALVAGAIKRAACDLSKQAADRITHRHLAVAAGAVQSRNRRPQRFEWPAGLVLSIRASTVELCVDRKKPA